MKVNPDKKQKKRSSRLGQQFMLFFIMLLVGFIVMNHVQSVRARNPSRNLIVIYRQR